MASVSRQVARILFRRVNKAAQTVNSKRSLVSEILCRRRINRAEQNSRKPTHKTMKFKPNFTPKKPPSRNDVLKRLIFHVILWFFGIFQRLELLCFTLDIIAHAVLRWLFSILEFRKIRSVDVQKSPRNVRVIFAKGSSQLDLAEILSFVPAAYADIFKLDIVVHGPDQPLVSGTQTFLYRNFTSKSSSSSRPYNDPTENVDLILVVDPCNSRSIGNHIDPFLIHAAQIQFLPFLNQQSFGYALHKYATCSQRFGK